MVLLTVFSYENSWEPFSVSPLNFVKPSLRVVALRVVLCVACCGLCVTGCVLRVVCIACCELCCVLRVVCCGLRVAGGLRVVRCGFWLRVACCVCWSVSTVELHIRHIRHIRISYPHSVFSHIRIVWFSYPHAFLSHIRHIRISYPHAFLSHIRHIRISYPHAFLSHIRHIRISYPHAFLSHIRHIRISYPHANLVRLCLFRGDITQSRINLGRHLHLRIFVSTTTLWFPQRFDGFREEFKFKNTNRNAQIVYLEVFFIQNTF